MYTPKKLVFEGKDYIRRWLYAHTSFGNYMITMEYPWKSRVPNCGGSTGLHDSKEEMMEYVQNHYDQLFAEAGDRVYNTFEINSTYTPHPNI